MCASWCTACGKVDRCGLLQHQQRGRMALLAACATKALLF